MSENNSDNPLTSRRIDGGKNLGSDFGNEVAGYYRVIAIYILPGGSENLNFSNLRPSFIFVIFDGVLQMCDG